MLPPKLYPSKEPTTTINSMYMQPNVTQSWNKTSGGTTNHTIPRYHPLLVYPGLFKTGCAGEILPNEFHLNAQYLVQN